MCSWLLEMSMVQCIDQKALRDTHNDLGECGTSSSQCRRRPLRFSENSDGDQALRTMRLGRGHLTIRLS